MKKKAYMVMVGILYVYQVLGDIELRVGHDSSLAKIYTTKESAKNIADFFGGEIVIID